MDRRRRVLTAVAAAVAAVSATVTPTGTSAAAPPYAGEPAFTPIDEIPIDIRPQWDPSWAEQFGPMSGAQVAITGASSWHDAGFNGTGIKIGVIDFFDVTAYWNVAEHGPTPIAGVTAVCLEAGRDCSPEFFDGVDRGSERHGVAVVEIIKDMAPGAEIYIARGLTANDYRSIIDWFASVGVRVINRSLGSRYDGPGDGRGGINQVATYAAERGITWVNSGGNGGIGRYYRQPVRLLGNRVAFGPSGSETFLRFNGCAALGGVRWANDWDKPPGARTDYDVFVWDSPSGNPAAGFVVASSTEPQHSGAPPLENIAQSICPSGAAGTRALYLEVRWRGGDIAGDILEILDYDDGLAAYTQAEYSASTGVVDSTDPAVLAVGAIDPANGTTAAGYSSRGPTNDDRIAPDLSAPSNVDSVALGGRFAGTSASSAVVSGGVVLLLHAGLAADPRALGNLVRHIAIDAGTPGPDNVYGHGIFRLPAPPTAVDTSPSAFVSLDAPRRILDTRPESAVGPAHLIGRVTAGELRDLPVLGEAGVPASGVTAVAVNITAVELDGPAYVQTLPTLKAALGGFSTLNTDQAGQIRANFAIVPVGANGSISLYTILGGHFVVDVMGYFTAAPSAVAAGRFVEIAPQRVLDTRLEPAGPLADRVPRAVAWPAGVDPASVRALVTTVTATAAEQSGWVQAFPTDRPDVIGSTSTVNVVPGISAANTAIVPVRGAGMSVAAQFGTGAGHVVVDVVGYITSASVPAGTSGRYVPVRPARAFDSRTSTGDLTVAVPVEVDAAAAPGVVIPADAAAVAWNVAVVNARQPGFGRVWSADSPQPATSAFNWTFAGEIRAASVISAVDRGRARIVLDNGTGQPTSTAGGLIADVMGYFT